MREDKNFFFCFKLKELNLTKKKLTCIKNAESKKKKNVHILCVFTLVWKN